MLRGPTRSPKTAAHHRRPALTSNHDRTRDLQQPLQTPQNAQSVLALQRTIGNRAVRPALASNYDRTRDLQQPLHTPQNAQSVLALQRTIGNRAVREILQRDDAEPDKALPSKTMYMGMNAGARGEVKALKGILKDDVLSSLNDPALEKSLETDAGIAKWLMAEMPTLVNNPLQFFFAYLTLQETSATARDQMAQAIKMFHAAEAGLFRLERMVLSGHSNGVELWGDEKENFKPGNFLLDNALRHLAGTFPKAAAQVEDVMFSACYTVSSIELVIQVFPNVRSVWGYAGASPAAGSGAEEHITKWEKETRGAKLLDAKDGMGKAALWTRDAAESSKDKRGYIRNDPADADLQELLDSYYGLELDAKGQLQGDAPINMNILNMAYFQIQMMLAHPELKDDALRAQLTKGREVLLRFRHYDNVCQNFASTYAAEIKNAYAAIGRTPPNFSKISRTTLRAEKDAFKAALAAIPNAAAQEFYNNYLLPFWKLDHKLIPATWI